MKIPTKIPRYPKRFTKASQRKIPSLGMFFWGAALKSWTQMCLGRKCIRNRNAWLRKWPRMKPWLSKSLGFILHILPHRISIALCGPFSWVLLDMSDFHLQMIGFSSSPPAVFSLPRLVPSRNPGLSFSHMYWRISVQRCNVCNVSAVMTPGLVQLWGGNPF